MATVKPAIRPSQPCADGSFGIKIALGAKMRTAYINTRYKIENLNQWKNGQVVRHPNAREINAKLRGLVSAIENIIDEHPITYDMSAKDLKGFVEQNMRKTSSFKEFADEYVARLKKGGHASYAKNMDYTINAVCKALGENVQLESFDATALRTLEAKLREAEQSDTTINIRMSHLKALLNSAVANGNVVYKVFPFRNYKMPAKKVRETWISKEELNKLRDAKFSGVSERRYSVARDLFMLSFYFAGINLTDLVDVRLDGDTINFVRKKTAAKKRGEKDVSLTIQPEARAIVNKYITEEGKLDFGYNYTKYEDFRSFVTRSLSKIGENLGFENDLMYYSARKTFVQMGQQLGIPLYVLEYSVGQTIKDANSRPIFDYMKVMRFQADLAIRKIIDYTLRESAEDEMPIPEWAR